MEGSSSTMSILADISAVGRLLYCRAPADKTHVQNLHFSTSHQQPGFESTQASFGETSPSFWLQSTFAVSAISTASVTTPPSVSVRPVSPLKKKL